MPINLNLSPAGRAKGRKKRLNPLPQALSSLSPAPPAKPLEYLETLSPARLVVRAIRNKESNRDIDHVSRLELLTQSTAVQTHLDVWSSGQHTTIGVLAVPEVTKGL